MVRITIRTKGWGFGRSTISVLLAASPVAIKTCASSDPDAARGRCSIDLEQTPPYPAERDVIELQVADGALVVGATGGRQIMTVFLVGAGPGDPDLLTVRAARLIAAAEVVLYDRLVPADILSLAPVGAELIDVGKQPGGSHVQGVINELLVAVGRSGRMVVRLKGGDPYLFGRGGEEVEALAAAGVPYDVVPGVSSALAAPAAAGIPVTHRGVARAVTIVTGHEAATSEPVAWQHLAQVGGTIVVLMGVERRAIIAAHLLDAGLAAATPVAVVHDATLPSQSVVTGRLDQLGELAVRSPAVIVIGAVAARAESAGAAAFTAVAGG
jgi:uroporphyrin-III C-methyltransferase